jgi:glycogen phosphorylase
MTRTDNTSRIAYFTMELALDPEMRTYSGGLGVLAGDTLRSAADLEVPLIGVTLLHRHGYFHQTLDASGWQRDEPAPWRVEDFLTEMPQRAEVEIEDRRVTLRCWKYELRGQGGYVLPIYFLDTDLPENLERDRSLTHTLYGGDDLYRLSQEVVLGIGGVRMLRALGHRDPVRFHMNEGHSSLLVLELLQEAAQRRGSRSINHDDVEAVRRQCVFTTHTPVPAGHDQFPIELVRRVLRPREDFFELQDVLTVDVVRRILGEPDAHSRFEDLARPGRVLNLTFLALNLSGYVNGVAKKHGEVSRLMFGGYRIEAVTNGVHAGTWVSEPFRELYDQYMPDWRRDSFSLRGALSIPRDEVWAAHLRTKRTLLEYVNGHTGARLNEDVLTIGFARRMTAYKRADVLLQQPERLRRVARASGGLQVVYAGKAHPRDDEGKEMIRRILRARDELAGDVEIAFLEDYDMSHARRLTAGVDLWLNTPEPPLEASGTSGMKAALNGIPSLSVLDGWWLEGHIEGVTGWAIGDASAADGAAESLYEKLEAAVLPTFYTDPERFRSMMLHCIALNGSFFNTHRMLQQYVLDAYFR